MKPVFAVTLSVALCLCGETAQAEQKVYEGREASALRCSNTLALTAVALSSAGLIEDAEKDVMLGITIRILERHVTGTWRQKKAAMEIMRDRRSVPDTLTDYRKNAVRCLGLFPIN